MYMGFRFVYNKKIISVAIIFLEPLNQYSLIILQNDFNVKAFSCLFSWQIKGLSIFL